MKTESQSESQGMFLDVQSALFQGTDLLGGHFLKLWFPFAFHEKFSPSFRQDTALVLIQ